MAPMGMFDRIHFGNRCGQVKCFGKSLVDCRRGDAVELVHPPATAESYEAWLAGDSSQFRRDERRTFTVAMGEGGYLVVQDGILDDWVDVAPDGFDVVDAFGRDTTADADHRYSTDEFNELAHCAVCAELRGEQPTRHPLPVLDGQLELASGAEVDGLLAEWGLPRRDTRRG